MAMQIRVGALRTALDADHVQSTISWIGGPADTAPIRHSNIRGFHLSGEGTRQLVESPLGAVLLPDILDVRHAASERHRGHVDCGHLGGEHRLDLPRYG
jgi:hypothetical protein